MKLLISNIQRFSLHDGPGIRTTVFFMGCPLRCPWCCNPENLTKEIKKYTDFNGISKVYGKEYDFQELEREILKDIDFYGNTGGVTYSGGEALMQLYNAQEMLKSLKAKGISQCIETSLAVPLNQLESVIDYIDIFYVDLKILNKKEFEEKLKGNIQLFKQNLEYLKANSKKISFRVPIVKGYTDSQGNIDEIKKYVEKYSFEPAKVFSVHNMAKEKYMNLNEPFKKFEEIENDQIKAISKYINKKFYNTDIC